MPGKGARRAVTVLLGDPALPDRSKPGGRFTADDFDQVARLRTALETLREYRFAYWNRHDDLLTRLRDEPPSFVLNFCDTGFRNEARRELHVPAYLEMLGIPCSGSGPVALGLCYDKALVRSIADSLGIPVPAERYLEPDATDLPELGYPAFIKPNRGDGSIGIHPESIVADRAAAERYVARLRDEVPGEGLLVQEHLPGGEYSVGVIGNPAAGFTNLPVLEVDYSALPPELPRLLDYGSKTDPDSPYWNGVGFRRAALEPPVLHRLTADCARLFARLGLRDYARFDFRADTRGVVRLMEVNPNPAWCHDGKLAHMAAQEGGGHADLLALILDAAWRRCHA